MMLLTTALAVALFYMVDERDALGAGIIGMVLGSYLRELLS
jgi:hypothetical protein